MLLLLHARLLLLTGLFSLVSCASTPDAPPPPRAKPDTTAARIRQGEVVDPMAELATTQIKRQIAMFYRLDLRENNAHTPAMVTIMRAHESKIRGCYTGRLDARPDLRGQVALAFSISKSTGTINRLKRVGGDIDDKPFLRCMKRQLVSMPFKPPYDMAGKLTYSFDFTENVQTSSTH